MYDISRNDAGASNSMNTTTAIGQVMDACKELRRKAFALCPVSPALEKHSQASILPTHVHRLSAEEHAVFLSGNGTLVAVLQEEPPVIACRHRKKRVPDFNH